MFGVWLGLALAVHDAANPAQFGALFEQRVARLEMEHGGGHAATLAAIYDYALFLKSTGQKEGAERLLRRLLASAVEPVQAAGLLEEVAGLNAREAPALLEKALAIREKAAPGVELARLYARTAAMIEERDPDAAIARYRSALRIYEKALGMEDPRIAIACNDLGLALESRERYQESEALYRRALAIQEKALGPRHPEVGVTLNNLAGALGATSRTRLAEPLLRRAVAILESSLGPRHLRTATAMGNLGDLLAATGRPVEGGRLQEQAIAVFEAAGDFASVADLRSRLRR